jgi:hypothetical protein
MLSHGCTEHKYQKGKYSRRSNLNTLSTPRKQKFSSSVFPYGADQNDKIGQLVTKMSDWELRVYKKGARSLARVDQNIRV